MLLYLPTHSTKLIKYFQVDDSDEDFREEEPDEDSDDDEVALKEEKPAAENKGAVKKQKAGKGKSVSHTPNVFPLMAQD